MEKMKKIIADHPVAVSALVTVAVVWAYHNGHLNSIFATPGKMLFGGRECKSSGSTEES